MTIVRTGNRLLVVIRHEIKVLVADRTLWLSAGVLMVLVVYALFNGVVQTETRDSDNASLLQEQAAHDQAMVVELRKILAGKEIPDPFANPADPASVGYMAGRHAVLPSAPLAPIAFGQSDMYANEYKVNNRSRVNFMYDSEIENPWNLLSGRFDLAFVVTYLLPLIIFSVSYNLLSAEREHGTLRMLMSQPLSVGTLLSGKVVVRASVLLGCTVVVPVLILLAVRPEARSLQSLPLVGIWTGLVIGYGLFWFALCALVNVLARSSAFNALTLFGAWVVLVLIMPIVVNLVVGALSPAPSRVDLATQTRLITMDSLTRFKDKYGSDYGYVTDPSSLVPKNGRFVVADRMRAFFLDGKNMDDKIEKVLDRFDAQLAGQQRLVDRYGMISPAILAHEGMATLAGNGSNRYMEFQREVKTYHERWKAYFEPRILNGIAINEADFVSMPVWNWHERGEHADAMSVFVRVVQIFVVASLVCALFLIMMRSYPLV